MMLGLFAQHRTGEGQRLESAMIVSNLYLNCEDALSYEGKPPRPSIDHFQYGTGATHRLYQSAPMAPDAAIDDPTANPDPRWVFVAADDDAAFARLCAVAGRDDLAADPRFADTRARADNRAALEAELESVFLTRTAPEWETGLIEAGVGCVVADARSHFAFLYRDAQADAIDMMVRAEHPSFGGTYWRYAPVIRLSETPAVVTRFCELGESQQGDPRRARLRRRADDPALRSEGGHVARQRARARRHFRVTLPRTRRRARRPCRTQGDR